MKSLIYFLIVLIIIYILNTISIKNNIFIEGCFVVIILYSTYRILLDGQPSYSLNKMFNLFNLCFFGFAPWLQFRNNVKLWTTNTITDDAYLIGALFIVFLIFIYNFLYDFSYNQSSSKCGTSNISHAMINISKWKLFLLFIISISVMIYIFAAKGFNITIMLFRGGSALGLAPEMNKSLGLINAYFVKPIPWIIFLSYKLSNKPKISIQIILGAIALFTLAPMAVARLMAAAIYIPVLLTLLPFLRKGQNFTLLFVGGLLFVFPFLNNFRRYTGDSEIIFKLDLNMFLEGHFDAFQQYAYVVDNQIITYGSQLLGSMFFFVPRSIWPDKPIGSGAFVARSYNFVFDNISMPYIAEGYINFGIVGSIVFVIILALISKKLDVKYWRSPNVPSITFQIQYLMLCGMLFFIMRGDLLSGVAYTVGVLTSIYVITKLISIGNVQNSSN